MPESECPDTYYMHIILKDTGFIYAHWELGQVSAIWRNFFLACTPGVAPWDTDHISKLSKSKLMMPLLLQPNIYNPCHRWDRHRTEGTMERIWATHLTTHHWPKHQEGEEALLVKALGTAQLITIEFFF